MTRPTLPYPARGLGAFPALAPHDAARLERRAVVVERAEPLAVHVADGYEMLPELEPAWARLQRDTGAEEPFSSLAWLRTWCDSFGGADELRILFAHDGERNVAALPLLAGRRRIYGLGLGTLRSPWHPHTPAFGPPVLGRAPEVYRALWNGLERTLGRWDLLQLPELPEESPLLTHLAPLALRRGYRVATVPGRRSAVIRIEGDWAGYLAARSSDLRENLQRAGERLADRGKVGFEVVTRLGALEAALDDGFALEAAARSGRAGGEIAGGREVESFYRRLARRAAEHGELELQFLTLDGRRIAFAYSLRRGRALYTLRLGCDPACSADSPELVLTARVLEEAHARGLESYDLLGETERWKLAWTGRPRRHRWLYVFRRSVRTDWVHWLKFRLEPRLRAERRRRDARGGDLAVV